MSVKTKSLSVSISMVNLKLSSPGKVHSQKNYVQAAQVFLAFFTQTGVGTLIAEGKEVRDFDGRLHILEMSLTADIALVKAYKADKAGNLVFRKTARNFNPDCAMAGKFTIAEVEQVVEIGEIDPDDIHLPGIYINRVVLNATPKKADRTTDH